MNLKMSLKRRYVFITSFYVRRKTNEGDRFQQASRQNPQLIFAARIRSLFSQPFRLASASHILFNDNIRQVMLNIHTYTHRGTLHAGRTRFVRTTREDECVIPQVAEGSEYFIITIVRRFINNFTQ